MSKTAKIIISISAIVLAIVTAVLIWMYYPAIKTAINGERYYTLEDVENAYNDGVNDKEEMESQINFYKIEIDKYIKDIADYQSKIKELNASLQDAINSGNADKETIAGLQEDLAEAQADISAKQAQIAELQDDIKFYQELLEAYEDSGKLVVTFTLVDNGVETTHDVQVVEPNGYLSAVVDPTASDFEGWSLSKGGDLIEDLTTVQVTENMTVYGMFTNTVTFMVNGEEYATQEVSYNKYATDVEVALTGYNLDGWSLTENGEIVTVSTTPITKDTTFHALLEKTELTGVEEYSWNGFNEVVGRNIWTDGVNYYYSSGVLQYVLDRETSTWIEKTWYGLDNILLFGDHVWNDGENIYYTNVYLDSSQDYQQIDANFILNKETSTWNPINMGELAVNSIANYRWTDGENIYISFDNEQYVFDKITKTWSQKTWNGLNNFHYNLIWTDGENIYYRQNYVLNKETSTWIEINIDYSKLNDTTIQSEDFIYYCGETYTLQSDFNAVDGQIHYYAYLYIFDSSNLTWQEVGYWDYIGEQGPMYSMSSNIRDIWTDGENYYYSRYQAQYILV